VYKVAFPGVKTEIRINPFMSEAPMFNCLSGTRKALNRKLRTVVPIYTSLLIVGTAAALVLTPTPRADTSDHAKPLQIKQMTLRRHDPMHLHRRRDQTTSESYNWAGYAVTGSKGSVTDVAASWVVPSVGTTGHPCPASTPPGEGPYAAFWVGIDGWNSNTVEQIGTDSDCVNLADTQGQTPTYYAWFEFYPQFSYLIGSYTKDGVCMTDCVLPGDYISAEVKSGTSGGTKGPHHGAGQQFTVTITDQTQNWTFSTSSSVGSAQQSSAEWIAETPYGCSTPSRYCLLSDFDMAKYGEDFTLSPNTASATVNGTTGAIASFGSNVRQAIMVTDPSGSEMALPSNLADTDRDAATSFTVTWKDVGP
jgi:hypothetical protein